MVIKAVILIGGPNKGQRFRPLSFDSPKYMFPVGGQTIVGHLIEACVKVEKLNEILLLGFYQPDETLSQSRLQRFVDKYLPPTRHVKIRYLQEFMRVGTAGGLYHFRDQIRHDNPEAFFVLNGDVCGNLDLNDMLSHHMQYIKLNQDPSIKPKITLMTTEASREDAINYGCIVENPESHIIEHYVEKPSTFVSNMINCGIYVCSLDFLDLIEEAMRFGRKEIQSSSTSDTYDNVQNQLNLNPDYLSLEISILQNNKIQNNCYSYRIKGDWWCQVKTASSAIYANRQYLRQYGQDSPLWLSNEFKIPNERKYTVIGDVYVHPTAKVDPTSVIGPNVSIMEDCTIGPGVRIKDSIVLKGASINSHSLVLFSIVGWNCEIGIWVRIEGASSDPDPNKRFAKVANPPLFNPDGKLNPSISVLGCNVKVMDGVVILNSVILPHKEISKCYKNEIVL